MDKMSNAFAEAFAAILKPIVKEAVREALGDSRAKEVVGNDRAFLTVKQAAETSGLGASTIRLLIRRGNYERHGSGGELVSKSVRNFW